MADQFNRWSKLVRTPGVVRIEGWHPSELPAESETTAGAPGRLAIRLLVYPIKTTEPIFSIDITSSAVIAMLEGFLRNGSAIGKYLSWRSWGFGSKRRDMVILMSELG